VSIYNVGVLGLSASARLFNLNSLEKNFKLFCNPLLSRTPAKRLPFSIEAKSRQDMYNPPSTSQVKRPLAKHAPHFRSHRTLQFEHHRVVGIAGLPGHLCPRHLQRPPRDPRLGEAGGGGQEQGTVGESKQWRTGTGSVAGKVGTLRNQHSPAEGTKWHDIKSYFLVTFALLNVRISTTWGDCHSKLTSCSQTPRQ
jgi:hypothetical protein